MCDPVSITIAAVSIGVVATGAGVAAGVSSQQGRVAQKKLAKSNARLQRRQVEAQAQQGAKARADAEFDAARAAAAAYGQAKAAGLSTRSVAAIGRAVNFDLGKDKATRAEQAKIASEVTAAKLQGIDITLASQEAQIGDTSGLTLGLDITNATLEGASTGLSIYSGLTDVALPGAGDASAGGGNA